MSSNQKGIIFLLGLLLAVPPSVFVILNIVDGDYGAKELVHGLLIGVWNPDYQGGLKGPLAAFMLQGLLARFGVGLGLILLSWSSGSTHGNRID